MDADKLKGRAMTDNDKLDRILTEVAAINVTMATMARDSASLAEKVDDHGATLYGNGRPGLSSRVQAVEAQSAAQDRRCSDHLREQAAQSRRTPMSQCVWGVAQGVATFLVVGVIALLFSPILIRQIAVAIESLK